MPYLAGQVIEVQVICRVVGHDCMNVIYFQVKQNFPPLFDFGLHLRTNVVSELRKLAGSQALWYKANSRIGHGDQDYPYTTWFYADSAGANPNANMWNQHDAFLVSTVGVATNPNAFGRMYIPVHPGGWWTNGAYIQSAITQFQSFRTGWLGKFKGGGTDLYLEHVLRKTTLSNNTPGWIQSLHDLKMRSHPAVRRSRRP